MNKLIAIGATSVLALSFVSCAEEPAWDTNVEIGPYPMAHRGLDARFKYGKVTIVWNKALSEAYAARMAEE